MAELPHRDIYVGMVAEDLAKDGYFGEEWCRYYYLEKSKSGEKLCEYENELPCVGAILLGLLEGKTVTDAIMLRKRMLGATAEERETWQKQAEEEARTILQQERGYVLTSEFEKESMDLLHKIKNGEIRPGYKILSGFVWWNAAGVAQYYTNAYLPNTWRKWAEKKTNGVQVSWIKMQLREINNQHPIAVEMEGLKKEFMQKQ